MGFPQQDQTASPTPTVEPGGAVPVLSIEHLSRAFGGVLALDDVTFAIEQGEVHGLLGENGSGKSTLIKILAGYYAPEEQASLEVNGRPIRLPLVPGQARELGISFVHQHLGLVPEMSVLDNFIVGELSQGHATRPVSWSAEARRVRRILESFGLHLDPRATVAELSQVDRARLAIVRAVEEIKENLKGDGEARGLLVLDEPTVFLPREGIDQLFALVRDVVARHASVLFVSHDLDEVQAITDRVTVLRDGRLQGTVRTAETSGKALVSMIVGRDLDEFEAEPRGGSDHGRALVVRGLCGGGVDGLTFSIERGEILGITGLIGSGFEVIPYLLYGARQADAGEVELGDGKLEAPSLDPRQMLERGVVLLPGDRQLLGSVGELTVGENLMLPVLPEYANLGVLRPRALRRASKGLLAEYDVRPANPEAIYHSLSGGNQQKALLAKWLQTEPSLVLVHEPTQGVDVGARQQIFAMFDRAAREGLAILCATSDYDQLARICDRVLVFGNGKVVAELRREALTKNNIAERAYGAMSLNPQQPEDPNGQ
jgi:ribose transport system ATP-binding protein